MNDKLKKAFLESIRSNSRSNCRNSAGYKDCINCYITIEGKKWKQWADMGGNKDDCKKRIAEDTDKYPDHSFIIRKIDGLFYRIYYIKKYSTPEPANNTGKPDVAV